LARLISDNLLKTMFLNKKTVEYKELLPEGSHESKKEFLADVLSFANTVGGHIIFGIREKNGLPIELSGLKGDDFDSEILRLENLQRDAIQPRIQGISMRILPIQGSKPVIILRIPQSWSKPYVVNFQRHWRFYARNSAGKYPLDVLELKSAFLASTTLGETIRGFHFERISKIVSNETPIPLEGNTRIILHTIPYSAFEPGMALDVHLPEQDIWLLMNPVHTKVMEWRYNLDGLVTYSMYKAGVGTAYFQLFRNGIIESVDSLMAQLIEGHYYIPTIVFEEEVIKVVKSSISLYQKLLVTPPIVILLSITGVRGFKLGVGKKVDPWKDHVNTIIDREILYLPEILIEDYTSNIPKMLCPIFDAFWNSAGWKESLGYDENGEWGKGLNFRR
jgi:hypothetical protein